MTVKEIKELIARWEAIDASLSRIKLNRLKEKITLLESENYGLSNKLVETQAILVNTLSNNALALKIVLALSISNIITGIYLFQSLFN